MNGMKLRKRKRNRIVYETIKILMTEGDCELNELISKLELLKLRYRLSPNKVAQILRNHPDIHRKQDFKHSNRIAVYTWKPSNVETNSL
jgi:hypothetical protein